MELPARARPPLPALRRVALPVAVQMVKAISLSLTTREAATPEKRVCLALRRQDACMGLLILSAHEGRVVRFGRSTDPTWRPMPGSPEDLADEADWEDEIEDRAGGRLDRLLSKRARRAGGPPMLLNVNSTYWRSRTRAHVLLIASDSGVMSAVGVGNCATQARRGWAGSAVVKLTDWIPFPEPVPLATIVDAAPPTMKHVVQRMFNEEESRVIPAKSWQTIVDALRQSVPGVDQIIADLPPFPQRRQVPLDRLTRRDASQTALRLFDSGWRNLEPVPTPPPPTPLAMQLESFASVLRPTRLPRENDAITADTAGFLDWGASGHAFNGWFLFRSGERQLLVKNINFQPEEPKTGADLVYVRSEPNSVVLVQYKMLRNDKGSYEYYFRDDGRLADQVDVMLKFSEKHAETLKIDPARTTAPDEYRISPDIGFVKFVEPVQPSQIGDQMSMPSGRYHPARGVLRMLANPTKGPGGGERHVVGQWRSLDGETFAKLVRDQWVGSIGDVTKELFKILGLEPDGPVYLAVEEPQRSA
jgi:hypothetical protein